MKRLSLEEFKEQYDPISTYDGEVVQFDVLNMMGWLLQASHKAGCNWTVMDSGEIVNGWAYVDRAAFIITNKPWQDEPYEIEVEAGDL